MEWLASALDEVASYPSPEALTTFQQSLEPEWIEQALTATGVATLRRRRLPAEQVIWLVLGMALLRDRPIHQVVSQLDLALPSAGGRVGVVASTVSQARARLGHEPLEWLFDRSAKEWAFASADKHRWKGLAVFALDGVTLRVADSEVNRQHFGSASNGGRNDGAYPLVRMVALAAARSHLIAAASFGPYSKGEHSYAKDMWSKLPADSVTIVDRNFFAARIFREIEEVPNRHWMVRGRSNTRWAILKKFGRDDLLVEMRISPAARKQDPSLPRTFTCRAVGYAFPKSKGKQWLFTSLTDTRMYSASDLVALYHQRWEIELAYDEVKTHLLDRQETIRSRTVAGVTQELWGILLTYNLIRLEMERIADDADLPPTRISFVNAMRFIRDEWTWSASASPGAIPEKLRRMREDILGFVLPERRSNRSFPRVVKIRGSHYGRKRTPARRQRSAAK